jgi:hypothetical protein
MKKYKFQYQIVQYIHDIATGEFVNVGIIVFQPEMEYLGCKFAPNLNRLSDFFEGFHEFYVTQTLHHFQTELEKESTQLNNKWISLTEITNYILPQDDSSLVCSKLNFGLDFTSNSFLQDSFNRLVNYNK